MRMHILLLAATCTLSQSALAQVSIGHRAGVSSFTWQYFTDGDTRYLDDLNKFTKSMTGAMFAVPIEVSLGKHWAIRPELGYVQRGMRFKIDASQASTTARMNQIDLSLLGKVSIFDGPIQLVAVLGPNISHGLNTRYISNGGILQEEESNTVDYGDDFYSQNELSAIAGAGFSIRLGVPRLELDYRYVLGITRIFKDDITFTDINGTTLASLNARHRGSLFCIGLMIPITRAAWQQ